MQNLTAPLTATVYITDTVPTGLTYVPGSLDVAGGTGAYDDSNAPELTWSGVLSPADIAAEIEKGLDFLEADWPNVPEGQRSIRAVFDRSWNLLTEREQCVFRALSVFPGGFTRAAAEQVGGVSLHELRALADKSLLQTTPSGRYEIHGLLRQYAAQ
ncbi:MAG: hypothetical protein ACK2U9_05815, partial [Anaerolineae bacterium]